MSVVCLIDHTEHESVEALHRYIRPKMKQEMYYLTYVKKTCLGTGEPIPFKDATQYLAQDFKDKNALKKWLKAEPKKGREWAINWLRQRKEEKGLVYAPSQAELRSLQCPSMPYYDSIGGYYAIARELGFKERYLNEAPISTHAISGVIQDSREQAPIKLGVNTTVSKLEYGDYASVPDHGIYIERKGLGDFVGTLNCRKVTRKKGDDSSFERFDRELARAAANGHHVVMLVEASINDALGFNHLPQMRWTKVSPSHVFKNLRDLLTKYPLNFQAVFADGRTEAARIALKVFEMGEQVRRIDLQHALEKGEL